MLASEAPNVAALGVALQGPGFRVLRPFEHSELALGYCAERATLPRLPRTVLGRRRSLYVINVRHPDQLLSATTM